MHLTYCILSALLADLTPRIQAVSEEHKSLLERNPIPRVTVIAAGEILAVPSPMIFTISLAD